jgi:hypothetical protein
VHAGHSIPTEADAVAVIAAQKQNAAALDPNDKARMVSGVSDHACARCCRAAEEASIDRAQGAREMVAGLSEDLLNEGHAPRPTEAGHIAHAEIAARIGDYAGLRGARNGADLKDRSISSRVFQWPALVICAGQMMAMVPMDMMVGMPVAMAPVRSDGLGENHHSRGDDGRDAPKLHFSEFPDMKKGGTAPPSCLFGLDGPIG